MSRKAFALTVSSLRTSSVPLACTAATIALLACGKSEKTDVAAVAPGGVHKACEVRRSWQHAIRKDCSDCRARSTTPKCTSCNVKPYSGVCAEEAKAQRAEPQCENIENCIFRCKGDCDCVDKCYEGKAACEKLSGVVDACVNKACEASCN